MLRIFENPLTNAEQAAEPNHIVLSQGIMRIGNHKTAKHEIHKEGVEMLPSEFVHVLNTSLHRWPRHHLFVDSQGDAYDNRGVSKWVIRPLFSTPSHQESAC
jgi:hypothetical protein